MQACVRGKWTLEACDIHAATQPIAERQLVEKTWELRRSDNDNEHENENKSDMANTQAQTPWLRKIGVTCPGFTFISAQTQGPFVRATADSAEVLAGVVVELESGGLLQVRAKASLKDHYLLVEIALPVPNSLRELRCHGSGIVVVEDGPVFAEQPDKSITMEAAGSVSLFVTSEAGIHARSLKTMLMGSGSIQISAASFVLHHKLEAVMASTGMLRIFAGNLQATKMKAQVASSGELQIAAFTYQGITHLNGGVCGPGTFRVIGNTLQAFKCTFCTTGSGKVSVALKDELDIGELKCTVNGTGKIRFGCGGHSVCNHEDLLIKGAGLIDAQDIVTKTAAVQAGVCQCAAILRAETEVRARRYGHSDIIVAGKAPRRTQGEVQFVPLGPSRVDHLMNKQSYPMTPPVRADAFAFPIRTSKVCSEVFGVVRDIWKDLINKPDMQTPVAVAVPSAMPLPGIPTHTAVAVALPFTHSSSSVSSVSADSPSSSTMVSSSAAATGSTAVMFSSAAPSPSTPDTFKLVD